jgi:hypothetical protein
MAAAICFSAVVSGSPVFAQQPRVGVSSAVNPAASSVLPGAPQRTLYIGNEIIFQERITTEATGQAQILFLDKSTMTIGSSADVLIDEFVYDPKSSSGRMVLNAGKGAFRFVGGALSKNPDGVTVNTSVASIGIRGGVMLLAIDEDATTAVFLHGDEMTVSGRSGDVSRIYREEFGVAIDRNGRVGEPRQISADVIRAIADRLKPQTRQRAPVDETRVAGLASQDTASRPETRRPDPRGVVRPEYLRQTVEPALGSPFSGVVRRIGAAGAADLAFRDGNLADGRFAASLPNGTLSVPVPATGGGSFAVSGAQTPFGAAVGTGFLSADRGFLAANLADVGGAGRSFVFGGRLPQGGDLAIAAGSRVAYASPFGDAGLPFLTPQTGANLPGGASDLLVAGGADRTGTVALQAGLGLDGAGGSQASALVVATAATLDSGGKLAFGGFVRGTSRLAADGGPLLTASTLGTVQDGAGNSFFGTGAPSFVLDQNGYDAAGRPRAAQATATGFGAGAPTSSYGFVDTVLPRQQLPPAARTAQQLSGFAAGIGNAPSTRGGQTSVAYAGYDASDFKLVTDPVTNRIAARFGIEASSDGNAERYLSFGGLQAPGRSAFVDDAAFGAIEAPSGAVASGAFVSAGTLPDSANALVPGGALCTCEYLRWGFWSAELTGPPGERFHLGTWVAGVETPQVSMPVQGVAAFSGRAIGSVDNNGRNYVATGDFGGTFDFARRTGAVSISKFDGRNLSGTTIASNGRNYQGGLSGGGLSGMITGTFFGPAAKETGGAFTLQEMTGARYRASGIFAGRR